MHFRRGLSACSIAAACIAASSSDAWAAECRSPDDAGSLEVNVDIDPGEPNVYNHLSKAQLGSSSVHGRRRQVLGTTHSGVDLRWLIDYRVEEYSDGYCFWVARIDVEVSYQQLDVNIAAEFDPTSCQYKAVLDHEYEHVEVAQSIMQPYAQQIYQALTTLSIPTADLPAVADSPEQARVEVAAVLRRTLFPVRDQMGQLLRAKQAEVDTIENYRRTWRRCRRW
jgi:hypothetical protein